MTLDVLIKIRTASKQAVEEARSRGNDVENDGDPDDPEVPRLDDDTSKEDAEGDLEDHDGAQVCGLTNNGPL